MFKLHKILTLQRSSVGKPSTKGLIKNKIKLLREAYLTTLLAQFNPNTTWRAQTVKFF
jgi:hypothetical protein